MTQSYVRRHFVLEIMISFSEHSSVKDPMPFGGRLPTRYGQSNSIVLKMQKGSQQICFLDIYIDIYIYTYIHIDIIV